MNAYRFELKGGPLAGKLGSVSDTEVRLNVVREDRALHLRPSDQPTTHDTPRPIGHYAFSHREESLVWFPAVE
jgi:hypothetical protein